MIIRGKTLASLDDDLRVAHVIADQVDATTMERFTSRDFSVSMKPDNTPVTEADINAEKLIRSQLQRARPRDAVVGEEFDTTGSGPRQWIVDPIDGTKNFTRGLPMWGTLLSLVVEDEPVVGLVSAPALGMRWWGAKGTGAWTGRSLSRAKRLSVSAVDRIADAHVSLSDLRRWDDNGRSDQMLRLMRNAERTRALGDFFSYMMIAQGAMDIACEPELEVYDMAALVPIVTEAGGKFTSLTGKPGPWHRSAVATNGLLHEETLAYFRWQSRSPGSEVADDQGAE